MNTSQIPRPGSLMDEALQAIREAADKQYTDAPMTPENAVGAIQAGAQDFAGYVRRIMIDYGENSIPFLKQYYIQALDSPELKMYRDRMDSAEYVRTYDLDRKLKELYARYGRPVFNPVEILRPGEVLWAGSCLILSKRHSRPKSSREVLEGTRNLWMRIVDLMLGDEWNLDGLEYAINDSIRKQGGWKTIRFKDRSYLSLLDPDVMREPGWGIAPPLHLAAMLGHPPLSPFILMTPEDKESRDWNTVNKLSAILLIPVNL